MQNFVGKRKCIVGYMEVANWGIHAYVILYIFAHLHTILRTERNMLDTAVSRKVVLQTRQCLRDNVESYYR